MALTRNTSRQVSIGRHNWVLGACCALTVSVLAYPLAGATSRSEPRLPLTARTVRGTIDRVAIPAPGSRPNPGDPRVIRSLLDIDKPMRFGEFVWDETGVPPGRMWVRVDLEHQIVSVFRGGQEIATAPVIYGAVNRPTPLGRLSVLRKERLHRSKAYDADMPYALFLNNDGVAIHASNVAVRHVTHGCIGVPEAFARKLFNAVAPGVPVDVIGPGR